MKKVPVKYILLLSGLLILLTVSCNKGLNLKPLDQLSDVSSFASPNDFKLFANQYYGFMKNLTNFNSDAHSDGNSDLYGGGGAVGSGTNTVPTTDGTWNSNYSGNLPTGAWSRIRATNYLLAKAATYSKPADIAQYVAEARFFRAYLYFDLLQQYGGAPIVDKLLDPTSPALFGARSSRDSVVDFIIADLQAAIPGLPASLVYGSPDYGRITQTAAQAFLSRVALYEGTWQKFRAGNATRYNALLDMAITASNSVINSHQYALFGTAASNALGGNSTILGDSAQKYMFILENPKSNPAGVTKSANHEYIITYRYDDVLKPAGTNINHVMSTGFQVGRKFVNMYLCKDGLPVEKSPLFQGYAAWTSEYQNRDRRAWYNLNIPYQSYWSGNANYRIDWSGSAAELLNASAVSYNPNLGSGYHSQKWNSERHVADNFEAEDYPVLRYAEVLLNYAEAVFERNGTIADADLDKSLNLVRLRINVTNGMPPLSNAFVTANSLDMRTEIRRERTIELYMEGFRIDDLKRWHNAITELGVNVGGSAYGNASQFVSSWPVGIKYTGTQYQNGPSPWTAVASQARDANGCIILDQAARQFSEKNYLLPIPASQLALNPALMQNPGWQ